MTTGRINQVAAFLAHPGRDCCKGRATRGASREISPNAAEATLELVSTERSAKMLRDRLRRPAVERKRHNRRLSFLESSLRILPARSQRLGDDQVGASKRSSDRDSRKNGCAASRPMPLKEHSMRELRTDTDCSGNGFGDKLAHRVAIQAPQPRLHAGLQEAQRQPGADWARTQSTGIDTHLETLDRSLHSAIGRNTQGRSVTHQLPGTPDRYALTAHLDCCQSSRVGQQTFHWASFEEKQPP